MPAILVECLFADSSDANKYNPEVISRAIVNGLANPLSSNENVWNIGWNKNEIG